MLYVLTTGCQWRQCHRTTIIAAVCNHALDEGTGVGPIEQRRDLVRDFARLSA
jgi:hypothetical protein